MTSHTAEREPTERVRDFAARLESDAGVIEARRRLTDIMDESTKVAQRRADLEREFDELHAQGRHRPTDLVDRTIDIQHELSALDTRVRALAAAKLTADRDVAAAVKAARSAEQETLASTARAITSRMIPLVETLIDLNAELDGVRKRADNQSSSWPLPVGFASLMPLTRWLDGARKFTRKDAR